MSAACELLEHAPLEVCTFRVAGDDFLLVAVNAAARAADPLLEQLIGRSITGVCRDHPQAILDARRCADEHTTVVRDMPVRRDVRSEATQLVRFTYVFVEPDHMLLFMVDLGSPHSAELAVRESEARYRSLVASLPDALTRQLLAFARESVAARGEPVAEPPVRQGKGVVLVVDDEDLVRNTALRTLQSLGYEVLGAADAEQAFACSAQHAGQIDMLLCDIAMPGRGGPSIAAELCRRRPELKVLFVSGYPQGTDDELLPGAGYLQKPYRRAELAAKLDELARR